MKKYEFAPEERSLLEGLSQPFAIYQFIDKRVKTIILSDGFCELFGYEDKKQAYYDMDNDMYKDVHPDDIARIADDALRFATEGGEYEVIYRTKSVDKTGYIVVHAMGRHVFTETGERLAHIWYTDEQLLTDSPQWNVSDLNQQLSDAIDNQKIINSSCYDYLTGMPNLTYFFELADIWEKKKMMEGQTPVMLFTNFSGMKYYNAHYGFAEGDELLREYARIMKKTFSNENCCHIVADHFAAITVYNGLDETLREFFLECSRMNDGFNLPVHVGVYPSRFEPVPSSTALDRAKFACDELNDTYGSEFNYYDHELHKNAEHRNYIVNNIDRALREKWIKVHYHPIVRAVNGKVCNEEALSRWYDPKKGMLSPADFIPALEEAGQIYKLDLYVLEQVLDKLKQQIELGFDVVSHSINLSRSDFSSCDIVEEITKRVDAAGIKRELITIEITESIIGSDFDFMKKQVERCQKLGFPVWMDDFGSGYSSPDILQSINFDLIKFDMNFMRKLDDGNSGKIVLSELLKMVTALGADSVCEGVESKSQVQFLQEIGCAKLQGFYYCKPMSFDDLIIRYDAGEQIGYEDPKEAPYYENIGKVNLYDLAVITSDEENDFQNFFNTIPMAILEIRDESVEFVRTNQSYRDFMRRFFGFDVGKNRFGYSATPIGEGSNFMRMVRECCEEGSKAFFDEPMPDGSVVHSFARWLDTNPVTGAKAAAIAVLSIT